MIQYSKAIRIEGYGNKAYEGEVKKLFDSQIQSNDVGKIILRAIDRAHDAKPKAITIIHYDNPDANKPCKSSTSPLDAPNAYEAGHPYFDSADKADDPSIQFHVGPGVSNDQVTRFHVSNSPGTGLGTDATIKFSPETWLNYPCRGGYAGLPDEVLLHELIHGLRIIRGVITDFPMEQDLYQYSTSEEYLAILVTNIYISLKRSTALRGTYDMKTPLAPHLSTSAGFLTDRDNVWMLTRFFAEEPLLFQELALVFTEFNPIREILVDVSKYHSLAFAVRQRDLHLSMYSPSKG